MRRKTPLPELLAPAGSFEAMLAAVSAGADAVYLGGANFGARAFAKNFNAEEMADAVRYCHLHGVKVYVTVNTALYDREIDEAVAYCYGLCRMGVDAVISTDLGLIRRIREEIPELPVHISTQFSVHNTEGVKFAASLGAERAVVARELSLDDIRSAVENSPLEIEVFLHGALCVCHSGQCLFSSLVGGRSGNRGECAQPCRLPYNGKNSYPLSLRDLSLAGHIRELIASGVSSLKVEGRMKSPDYVYRVTKIYRTLLDANRNAGAEEQKELADVFSRGGFTDGYFTGKTFSPMTGVRSDADKEKTEGVEKLSFAPIRIPVSGRAVFRLGVPCELTLTDGKKTVTVTGDMPTAAQNAPLTKQDLSTRLCKMGSTYLSLDPKDLEIEVEPGINLPPSAVNALRRLAAEKLQDTSRDVPDRAGRSRPAAPRSPAWKTAVFYDGALFEKTGNPDGFFDMIFIPLAGHPGTSTGAFGVIVPPVVTDAEFEEVKSALADLREKGVTHALVGNPGMIRTVKDLGYLPVGDFRLNVNNSHTADGYRERGIDALILSPELTLPMMRDVGGGAIVYGRIPLMLTERCFVKENGGCSQCGKFTLTDRMGKRFPILREYPHRNQIFNSVPTYMGDRKDALAKAGIRHWHFLFTVETPAAVHGVIASFKNGTALSGEVRRIKM